MTPAQRRRPKDPGEIARNMSAIRSHDNQTESRLRRALHAMGLRYRKYVPELIGRPDIVFRKEKVAVFVDGDYWHGRMVHEGGVAALESYYTRKQQTYWVAKLTRNVARDDRVTTELRASGWKVLRFWESDIKKDVAPAARRIAATVRPAARYVSPVDCSVGAGDETRRTLTARRRGSRSARPRARGTARRGVAAPAWSRRCVHWSEVAASHRRYRPDAARTW